MRRAMRHILVGLLLSVAALAGGAVWLLGSSSGAATALDLVPGLRVEKVEGRLYDTLRLEGVHWHGEGATLDLAHLTLEWSPLALWRMTLKIGSLEADGLDVALAPAGEPASTTAAMPSLRLPLDLQLEQLLVNHAQIRQAGKLLFSGDLKASGQVHNGVLTLAGLELKEDRFRLRLQGSLPLDGSDGLALAMTWSATTPELGKLQGSAQLTGRLDALQIDHRLAAPWSVRTQGSLRPFDELRLDLDGSWEAFAWPPGPDPAFTSPQGSFSLHGTPAVYDISLQGTIVTPGLPAQELQLSGSGGSQSLQLRSLAISGPAGLLDGSGQVAWAPHPSWTLDVAAQGFNPATFAPDWPGAIDLKGRLEGEFAAQGLTQTLALQTLGGKLRGYPVSGQGNLRQYGNSIEFQSVALNSGSNTLALDGKLGDTLDLRFKLVVEQPDALLPELTGRFQGSGQLQGTRDDPRLEMTAQGSGLAWQDYRLARLDLEARWGVSDGQGRIRLEGEGLEIEGERFAKVQTSIEGETTKHRIQLLLDGKALSAKADASGGWRAGRWQGQIMAFSLAQPTVGEWALTQPTALALGSNTVRLAAGCLAHGQSRVCGDVETTPERRIAAKAQLEHIEVSDWVHLLGEGIRGTGTISASLNVSGSLDTPAIEARVTPMQGTLQWPIDGSAPLAVDYRLEQMAYSQKARDGSLAFRFDLGPRGRLSGLFTRQQDALGGRFTLTSEDPAWLGEWLTQVSEIRGRLDLEGRLGGTLNAPTLSLQGGLTDGHLIVADSGIEVDTIELRFTPDKGDRFALQGSARSGGGTLAVSGWVNTAVPSWSLQLKGEAFQVARLPEAEIWISPDLGFSQENNARRLAGQIRLPRANLNISELPEGTVSESADVVVVDHRYQQAGSPQGGPAYLDTVALDLDLLLGDQVQLKGYGLRARLAGRLHLTSHEGQVFAEGQINLHDGIYRSYGQDLTLERGNLLFTGPLDNPALDLVAYRMSFDGSVKAILKVAGTPEKPILTVASEPALSSSEALAYLITGAPLADADKGKGADIYNAALSLGLTQSEPMLMEMRDRFGLDEFQVKGGAGLEQTALSLGKQLQHNLYLGYTVGLFDNTGAILLRIKLGKRMELETRSGEQQSVDLFYRIERD